MNTIAILGDIFDDKKKISQKAEHTVLNFLKRFNQQNLRVILIAGNHDKFYKDRHFPNWLTKFKHLDNVVVVEDKPYFEKNCVFLPWDVPIEIWQGIDYVFGHFEISGFFMNNSKLCELASLSVEDFYHYKVFSGHFHKKSKNNNIHYIGSSYPMDFNDVGDKRGYYTFNDGKTAFYEFTNTPKFVKLYGDKIDFDNITGNFIKLIFKEDLGAVQSRKLIEKIESKQPLSIIVDNSRISSKRLDSPNDENNNISENLNASDEEIMLNYIDKSKHTFPRSVDIRMLKSLATKLIKEVKYEN
jgi:DNA repair exonuclease SbcCD nuclease subunit